MNNPLWDRERRSDSSRLLVSIIACLVGLALLVLGAVAVVRCRKRKPTVSYVEMSNEWT